MAGDRATSPAGKLHWGEPQARGPREMGNTAQFLVDSHPDQADCSVCAEGASIMHRKIIAPQLSPW